jgi:hypothetical protein
LAKTLRKRFIMPNVESTGWLAAQAPGGKSYQNDPETNRHQNDAVGRQFGGLACSVM